MPEVFSDIEKNCQQARRNFKRCTVCSPLLGKAARRSSRVPAPPSANRTSSWETRKSRRDQEKAPRSAA